MKTSDVTPEQLDLVDADQLPPQIRQLVRLIGLPATFRLLDARGGTPLRIPVDPHRAEILIAILEPTAIQALSAALGGQTLELPKVDKMLLQIRNLAIREARKTMSASEVARAFKLTRRMVIYVGGKESNSDQPDLFA